MHIQKIILRNILGIQDLELTPEGFTTITGKNGKKKTSLLEGIKAALQTGHDASLLRNGAESGEVVLLLDDGMSITKKVGATSSSTEVRGADGKKLPRPAEAIRALTDMMSVNPVEFLTAPKKDRVRVLLESMPLEADVAELTKRSGVRVTAQPGVHALQVIEAVHKQVYDDRTGTNRLVGEKDGTIKQLRQAMPDPVGGVEGSEDELADQIAAHDTARVTLIGKINAKLSGLKDKARDDIDVVRVKLQEDIDTLKTAATEQVETIKATLADSTNKAAVAAENAAAKYATDTAPLVAALTAIRTNREGAAKRQQTVELIEQMEKELAKLRADAAKQTAALTSIEAYKTQLLSDLPIRGLEVKDGEIFRDGVPFDRINTAAQVEVAVGIAKLRAGELGIVCIDRIECLDAENLEQLRIQIAEAGLQCFVTRVSDEDFAIHTQD